MKKNIFYKAEFLLALFIWLGLAACQSTSDSKQEVTRDTPSQSASLGIKYAQNFQVIYKNNYKIVRILKAFEDSQEPLEYVLIPRGEKAPEGFLPSQVIETPIQKLITLSATHVAMVDVLNLTHTIVGNSQNNLTANDALQARIDRNQVVEVGDGQSLNQELVLSLNPDLMMAIGFSQAGFAKYQTLINTGIQVIPNSEWLEPHPLGRAEWLKFIAAFYNAEPRAEEAFSEIESQYLATQKIAQKAENKPKILVGLPFKGTWYVSRGGSFMGQLFRDAQLDYYWSEEEGVGSLPLDFEAVFDKAQAADFWINPGLAKSKSEMLAIDERFTEFQAFEEENIYNQNKRILKNGVNAYWSDGVVKPHLILSDLVKICHPELLPEHELYYYQKLK